ncbi:Cardiolipin synthetase [plant metagenome]|uniref:Cardiolipin synthase B n=2 Tax=root TaxID=1 RepID=A0A1C3JXF3_9BURK|nr:cardiolipin synthase ClsB [Orrella dioscoreae]SBT23962.1 Cardiolipin synthetase [Orrella dioscoreae]SOE47300.1 Cardiolipin synthetase [Orrella dioscoreae]
MNVQWRSGNRFELLENGEEFFPRVIELVGQARKEVLVETFILFDDKVGQQIREALIAAARRGVQVELTVDGYGSEGLSEEFVGGMTDAGVGFHVFDPRPRVLGMRTNWFRRMHRKIVTIDGERALIGGINYSADHLADFGPEAKQDYAVQIDGPLAGDLREFARKMLAPAKRGLPRLRRRPPPEADLVEPGTGRLVFRDNGQHRDDIERVYRTGIRSATREILIANAYFFPGFRLLHDLARAARRGVRVRLILQGQPDMPVAKMAAGMLYEYLLEAGVEIYEYCQRPLHGKVAIVDDEWSTIGSSNLDPLSLSLNLEANVVVRDPALNQALRESLERLMAHHCQRAPAPSRSGGTLRRLWTGVFVFHFLRRFPAWAGYFPAHRSRLKTISADAFDHSDVGETS